MHSIAAGGLANALYSRGRAAWPGQVWWKSVVVIIMTNYMMFADNIYRRSGPVIDDNFTGKGLVQRR